MHHSSDKLIFSIFVIIKLYIDKLALSFKVKMNVVYTKTLLCMKMDGENIYTSGMYYIESTYIS